MWTCPFALFRRPPSRCAPHARSSSLTVSLALLLLSTPMAAQNAQSKTHPCLVTYTVSQWGFAGWTGQRLTIDPSGTAVLRNFRGQFSEGEEAGRITLTADEIKRLTATINGAGFAGAEVRYAVDRAINPSKAALTFCPVDRSKNVISLDSTSSPPKLESWNRLVA